MAVTVFPRTRAHSAPLAQPSLPSLVLLLILVAPALDLMGYVQAGRALAVPALLASAFGAAALFVMWLRYLRISWLFAAMLAAVAGAAMRLVGADVAPALSLLAVLGVGLGGAFGSSSRELMRVLEEVDAEPAPAALPSSAERRPPVIAA